MKYQGFRNQGKNKNTGCNKWLNVPFKNRDNLWIFYYSINYRVSQMYNCMNIAPGLVTIVNILWETVLETLDQNWSNPQIFFWDFFAPNSTLVNY